MGSLNICKRTCYRIGKHWFTLEGNYQRRRVIRNLNISLSVQGVVRLHIQLETGHTFCFSITIVFCLSPKPRISAAWVSSRSFFIRFFSRLLFICRLKSDITLNFEKKTIRKRTRQVFSETF